MKIVQHVKKIKQHSIDIEKIIHKIDDYDVVSFDIFDTLLKRNIQKPTDVFKYMEVKYGKEGFYKERILAEKKSRLKKENSEITLKDIYDKLPYDFSQKEMETESDLLIVNDIMLPVYKKALQNKIVIITSDMYLPEDFIKKILKREGIIGYKKLYLSSSIGKKKSDGELFDFILKEVGNKKKIIHIGDSFNSDYKMPISRGIDAIQIPRIIDNHSFQLKESNVESNILNSFLNNTVSNQPTEYYRFGYEKFGMFLWGYSHWLHNSIIESNIGKVYFFSRDGLIMKKAFDILFDDIQTHYLEVSRRALRVPILWMNYKLEHVINMISPSKLISLSTIFDGVGLDINNYKDLIKKYGFEIDSVFERKNIIKNRNLNLLYSELSDDIEQVSRKEYELLVQYIQQNSLSGSFAIVDIGWSGGMQRYLIETLTKLGIKAQVKGYYVGVADYYKRNIEVIPSLDLNGYLFDFSHNGNAMDKRSPFVGLFETLFLEQGGSVKNYKLENGKVVARRFPYEYLDKGQPTFEYKSVKEIQKGALDFVDRFKNYQLSRLSAEQLFEGLEQTGLKPNKQDLKMFADFRFFDEGETQYLAKPENLLFYITHIKKLKNDFLSCRWKIGFMKRLLKVNLPYEKLYKLMLKYK